MTRRSRLRCFKTSLETIRLAAMMDIRFLLSLRNAEDELLERGIQISHETVRFWWRRLTARTDEATSWQFGSFIYFETVACKAEKAGCRAHPLQHLDVSGVSWD